MTWKVTILNYEFTGFQSKRFFLPESTFEELFISDSLDEIFDFIHKFKKTPVIGLKDWEENKILNFSCIKNFFC